MSGSTAGGSAAARARELRAKAAKLEEQARAWEKGAEGERRTAAVLSSLAQRGYVVLDDLSIPGSRANIDHVVIGPTGVTVIETKAYTGRLTLRSGVLWHGRYPLRREIEAARFEADKVREVVQRTGWPVMVRSLMCIHSDGVPSDPDASLAPIQLCSPVDLLATIEAAPQLLEPHHLSQLASEVERSLPPRNLPSGAPTPVPAHEPRRPDLRLLAGSTKRRGSGGGRNLLATIGRFINSAANTAVRLIAAALIIVIGLAVILAIAGAVLEGVVTQTTTTTTAATTVPAAAPTPQG